MYGVRKGSSTKRFCEIRLRYNRYLRVPSWSLVEA
jgi:hypothetical protein